MAVQKTEVVPPSGFRMPKMFASLVDPNFRAFLLASTFSSVPMASNQVTQGYLAYQLSGSATGLGAVTLAWGLPQMLLTAFAGVLADRFERRRILMITQSASGILTVLTALLIHLNMIEVWHLAVIAFVQGSFFAFNMPARQGMVTDVVPPERIPNAIALNNTTFQVTRIGGPAIAGALIAVPAIGIAGAYNMLAGCYFLAAVFLMFTKSRPVKRSETKNSVLGDLGIAFSYIRHHPVLPTLMLMGLVPVLMAMPFQMLTPVFSETMFQAGPTGLGLMLTMTGVGSLIGSFATAALAESNNKSRLQMIAIVVLGAAMILFSFTTAFATALALMLVVGGASNFYMSLNSQQMLSITDRALLGRVIGIWMLSWSFTPLTTFPVSASIDHFGAPQTAAGLGVLVIVAALAIGVVGRRTLANKAANV